METEVGSLGDLEIKLRALADDKIVDDQVDVFERLVQGVARLAGRAS